MGAADNDNLPVASHAGIGEGDARREAAPRLQSAKGGDVFATTSLLGDESAAAAGAPLGGTIFRTFLLDYPPLEGL